MENGKIEMKLCMGSSCFSRGNNEVLELVKNYIDEYQLSDVVDFRGHLCKCSCNSGPNFSIGDTEYHEVSLSNIKVILEDYFKKARVE